MPEHNVETARLHKHLQTYLDSPTGNRCLTCGHVKHNELGYCQVGQCGCGDGTTVAGLAGIIRRDLPTVLAEVADLARRATLDPGAFVKRGPDYEGNAYGERLDQWQARAIAAAISSPPGMPSSGGDR